VERIGDLVDDVLRDWRLAALDARHPRLRAAQPARHLVLAEPRPSGTSVREEKGAEVLVLNGGEDLGLSPEVGAKFRRCGKGEGHTLDGRGGCRWYPSRRPIWSWDGIDPGGVAR
jgi:hypothetical protein